jgi:nicotinate-nucleotide adenylyltransferase
MERLMRIGVFGGSFDPPHIGHLILAEEARWQLGMDAVLWVLTPTPPHKPGQQFAPLEARRKMVSAAIEGNPHFLFSAVDVERPGPHYAVDTLILLKNQFPQAQLIYLIGGDSLRDLPTWRHPVELVQTCDGLGVMRRPGEQPDLAVLEEALPGVREKVSFIEAPLLQIASSQIRARIAARQPVRYYLPAGVLAIIEGERLY